MTRPALEMAYSGGVVPDAPPYNLRPFSRSAYLAQAQFLEGMAAHGQEPSLLISMLPATAFPRGRRLWARGERVEVAGGRSVLMLPFLNVVPFKQAMVALEAFAVLWAWSIRRLGRPRVIYMYNLTAPWGPFMWLAARLSGARFCAALFDIEIPGRTVPDTLAFRLDYWMHKWLVPRLDGRIVISRAIEEDFAQGRPCLLVDGGVGEDLVARTEPLLAHHAPDSARFRLVAVGSLTEINGFDLMLEAMAHLEGPGWTLDIAGRGPLQERVEQAAAADPRIRFHGFLDLDAVLDLYGRADLLLVVRKTVAEDTRYVFPGKLQEALVTGIPVLATATGHLKEAYGAHLHVLEDESAQGLAGRIREIAALPAEARLRQGRAARSFMVETHSWKVQAGRILDHLAQVMGGDPA